MTQFVFKLALGFCLTAAASTALASDVEASLNTLRSKLTKYGAAKLEGEAALGDKKVPVLHYGGKKINGAYDIVDDVKKSHGGTATIFVKSGDEFVRVSTNVLKDDGTRAVGTTLAKNKANETVSKGEKFCGVIEILGSPFDTCYEPIKDAAGKIIGVIYVGYKK